MPRVRLVAWNAGEAAERAKTLRDAGFTVDATPFTPASVRALTRPPDAFVIDLDRAPSRGRDTGLFLRQRTVTRPIPLVFAGGAPEAITPIRRVLPDAHYAGWSVVAAEIREAIAHPPELPRVPGVFAPFAGTPLSRKLGIKSGSVVALIKAPAGFEDALDMLPSDARLRRGKAGAADLTLWFVRTRRELEADIKSMASRGAGAGLWILWPKRTGRNPPDVNQIVVRKTGLANGLVDFKITSVDRAWAGLRFTQRRSRKQES